jgi:spermidine synthase
VVVHTWPDRENAVVGDISVCNYSEDNAEKADTLRHLLLEIFAPEKTLVSAGKNPRITENLDLTNGYDINTSLDIEEIIIDRTSPFQDIKVLKSRNLGKVLVLDNIFQTSERDEFFYHEPLVHIPLITHDNPSRVLIIGGGDGGSAEEVLKHPSVETCILVELDEAVFQTAEQHLDKIHKNVFQNDRLKIFFQDGFAYLKGYDGSFDVIILDLTDPIGKSIPLYTSQFYHVLQDHLSPGGLASMHMGIITHDPPQAASIFKSLETVFGTVRPYLNYVPLYGGMMGFCLCGSTLESLSPTDIDARIEQRNVQGLHLLNGNTYQGMFALPNYVKEVLGLKA